MMNGKTPGYKDMPDLQGKTEEIMGELKKGFDRFMPSLRSMADEVAKTTKPISKKDIMINNKQGYVSLLSDGRVVIHSPSMEDAMILYDLIKGFGTPVQPLAPWYKRIFNFAKW